MAAEAARLNFIVAGGWCWLCSGVVVGGCEEDWY